MSRAVGVTLLIVAAPAAAQRPDVAREKPFSLSGEIGSDGELYRISGRAPRRPGESARLSFNPTLTFRSFTVTGTFLLSTEGTSTLGLGGLPGRQRINQFGLNPKWSWGKAYLGSFSDTYSPLTWTGVRLDGAGFELTPGLVRLGLIAGSSREPVFGGATSGSFGRSLLGARVGLGRKPAYGTGGRFIDLMFIRVRDDPASLPPLADTTSVPFLPDSLAVEPDTALLPRVPINPYAVTPQENAVLATAAGLTLLRGVISWKGEVAGSIHSRDIRASEVADELLPDYPRILRGLVTPRAGTHVDYAYQSQLDLRIARLPGASTRSPRSLTTSINYQSIGAGYVSLGTAYLPNDVRGVDVRTALRFRSWSLQLDGLSQRDNLLSQKLATTDRSRVGASFVIQPRRGWNTSLRVSRVGMNRNLADSLGAVDYSARTLMTSQTWIPNARGRLRSLTASYTWLDVGDANPIRSATNFQSHTADLRVALALGARGSLTPTLGVSRSRAGASAATTRATYGLAGDWRDPKRRWTSSASISRAQLSRTNALTARLSTRVPVTASDDVTLVVRLSRYRSAVDSALDFDERVINLRWSRRL